LDLIKSSMSGVNSILSLFFDNFDGA
jgi:hypothetical protein